MKRILLLVPLLILLFVSCRQNDLNSSKREAVTIVIPQAAPSRVTFGAEKLKKTLEDSGYETKIVSQDKQPKRGRQIRIDFDANAATNNVTAVNNTNATGKEGFTISTSENVLTISGNDASGALYGCLELADRVKSQGKIPANLQLTDQPEMVLRGTAIGVQKTYYLPGRTVYEYPYTEEEFPWFYDKKHWTDYLDMMVENRYNSLYLWNGHPFASLVKLPDYPYALEVDEETFAKNEEMYRFLTEEAEKRGIWVIQMFYNIIVSKPFAEKHGIKTQERNRPITPLLSDYTRKSIAAFVEKYPNVGLLITLGEAMEGVGQDDVDWFTKTIIPGVQDGLKATGQTIEPPIVLRAHDTDAPRVMKAALPIYKNLYTMAKYNGEALTTYTPRGKWAELHRSLSRIGTVHIQNVHILANLEPFRYSSPDFIQKSVIAMHDVYESNGLHLYPQASYWDWPYAADKTEERLLQIDRDWMWYEAWARYAWKARRDKSEEETYWSNKLGKEFGMPAENAKHVLEAHEEAGEISPKILRRFGITDGNRQTSTLGMLMTQLINPFRYSLFTMLYESEAPEGEMIIEYGEKEWKKEPHIGETPLQVAEEIVEHGRKAVEAIDKAAPAVTRNKEEFDRLKNDMYSYNAMANHYSEKVKAAIAVLRFKYSEDVADLEKALPHLEKSVAHYRDLVKLTKDTYLYANSMQTPQRKIPVRATDGAFKHWEELLPIYEEELETFKTRIDSLKTKRNVAAAKVVPYKNAHVVLQSKTEGSYTLAKGQKLFSDTTVLITDVAPELKALKGIRFSKARQVTEGTNIRFTANKPVKLLVGYFNKPKAYGSEQDPNFARAPELETDATANDYGQGEIKISNAVLAGDLPPVNVHAYSFGAGNHTLNLPKGALLLLGFIDGNQEVRIYDAGLAGSAKDIDWLFE
ncbi:alpha-d-galacturonidase [Pontibacter beigongshangensis]|uniref:alpha-d-galacturonidase n=1 Tax=Pontibacter beigongshangensis TaxID=2574733 RepID=UPI00164FDB8F|nr:glycoside hydrolase family 20 zincin-like fold domain-containing protein [Pontibacter beigongshangensis]